MINNNNNNNNDNDNNNNNKNDNNDTTTTTITTTTTTTTTTTNNNNNNNDRLYCRLPSYKYNMVYNKDPINKEKAIEKTYIHLHGLKKKWYQVMLFVSLQYLTTSYNTPQFK